MEIIISNASELPIYEQIYNQIKEGILVGTLEKDRPLPSIRSLAKDLKISVITTKRAYDELERDGFIYTVASKGSFVKGTDLNIIREEYLKKLESSLSEARDYGNFAGLKNEEMIEIFKFILEDK